MEPLNNSSIKAAAANNTSRYNAPIFEQADIDAVNKIWESGKRTSAMNIHRWRQDNITYSNSTEKISLFDQAIAFLIDQYLIDGSKPAYNLDPNALVYGQQVVPEGQAEDRVNFAVAADALNMVRDGIVTKQTCSSGSGNTAGGSDYFFLNNEDIISFLNQPGNDQESNKILNDGAGYIAANNMCMKSLANPAIKIDFFNTIILYAKGNTNPEYKRTLTMKEVRDISLGIITSPEYSQCVSDALKGPTSTEARRQIMLQMVSDDNFGLSILDPQAAESAFKALNLNLMAIQINSAHRDPNTYITNLDMLTANYSLASKKMAISLARSSIAAVKQVSTAITTIEAIVSGEAAKDSQVLVCELIRLNNLALTKIPNLLADEDIAAAASKMFTNNIKKKDQIVSALKSFNNSGLFGSIGSALTITALTMTIIDYSGKTTTTDERIGLASLSLSILGGLSTWWSLYKTVPKFVVATWHKIWGGQTNVPELYGSDNSIGLAPYPSTSTDAATLKNINDAAGMAETSFTCTNVLTDVDSIKKDVIASLQKDIKQKFKGETELDVSAAVAETRGAATKYVLTDIVKMQESSTVISKFVTGYGIIAILASVTADILNVYEDAKAIKSGNGSVTNTLSTISDVSYLAGDISTLGTLVTEVGWATRFLPGIGLFFYSLGTIFWLSASIKTMVDSDTASKIANEEMTRRFNRYQDAGYVSDWGAKIQFLAAYYAFATCLQKSKGFVTRFAPGNKSIFVTEADAYQKFLTYDWKNDALAAFNKVRGSMVLEMTNPDEGFQTDFRTSTNHVCMLGNPA